MKKNKIHAHVNRIMMVLLPAIILLMIMLGWWLGLFTEIEEEQDTNETSDRIVDRRWAVNRAGGLRIRNPYRGFLRSRTVTL